MTGPLTPSALVAAIGTITPVVHNKERQPGSLACILDDDVFLPEA
jgi:hypothetical protein